mgnify:CR=1 FL=1
MADNVTAPAAGTNFRTKDLAGIHHPISILTDFAGADAMGLVTANPAANTLLGRLKAIADASATVELGGTSLAALETIDLGATSLAALENITVGGTVDLSGGSLAALENITVTIDAGSLAALETIDLGATSLAALENITATLDAGSLAALETIDLGATSLAALENITVGGTVELGATSLAALESITATGPLTDTQLRATAVPVNIDASLKSGTPTRGSVNSGTSSVTILASNANRKGATMINTDPNTLLLDLSGGTASATRHQQRLSQYQSYEVPSGYTGAITGIWEADGAGVCDVVEFT